MLITFNAVFSLFFLPINKKKIAKIISTEFASLTYVLIQIVHMIRTNYIYMYRPSRARVEIVCIFHCWCKWVPIKNDWPILHVQWLIYDSICGIVDWLLVSIYNVMHMMKLWHPFWYVISDNPRYRLSCSINMVIVFSWTIERILEVGHFYSLIFSTSPWSTEPWNLKFSHLRLSLSSDPQLQVTKISVESRLQHLRKWHTCIMHRRHKQMSKVNPVLKG